MLGISATDDSQKCSSQDKALHHRELHGPLLAPQEQPVANDWLLQECKGSAGLPQYGTTLKKAILPPDLSQNRYRSWVHSPKNLPHAILHLRVCFRGTLPRTWKPGRQHLTMDFGILGMATMTYDTRRSLQVTLWLEDSTKRCEIFIADAQKCRNSLTEEVLNEQWVRERKILIVNVSETLFVGRWWGGPREI